MMRRNSRSLFVLGVLCFFTTTSVSYARPVQKLSFEELMEQADVVIIGEVESTGDLPTQRIRGKSDTAWIAVQTTFQLEGVMKGKVTGEKLSVIHHRHSVESLELSLENGPGFVKFNPELKHRYLIFLKQGERSDDLKTGGPYIPVTGQYDPGFSFFLLEDYHPTREEPQKVTDAKETR